MIPAIKKNAPQDPRAIVTIVLSLLWFIPFPVFFSAIGLFVWGLRSKVRLWVWGGLFFMLLELVFWWFIYLVDKAYGPHNDTGAGLNLLILLGWAGCYLVTNLWLLLQLKNHFYRVHLAKTENLQWSNFGHEINKGPEPVLGENEAFIRVLQRLRGEIENTGIKNNIDRMVSLFRIIADKDPVGAEKFLVTHATVVNVLTQYDNLENARLDNEVSAQSKKQLEEVVGKATLAFEQELTNRFKTEIMEVSAETDAYIQQLKNKNLIQ